MAYVFSRQDYERRVAWFTRARFGLFIHWGLYAIPARGEWVRGMEKMSPEEYLRYFHCFDPRCCDMDQWMARAKAAGAGYVVLTAKHHDGFCLFDSAYTDFKSTNTPARRDFVREYVDAARRQGLKVGLYYSLLDWHHPDYPHFGDAHHPRRDDPSQGNEGRDFGRYLDYMHAQVRELCVNYGKLDLLWFDFSYGQLRGEAWRATELVDMVRTLQPDIVLNNRLEVSGEGFGSLAAGAPTAYHGDFVSPEQILPPQGLRDPQGRPLVWESCVTMNNHWGYCATDRFYKSAPMLIHNLVRCVSRGGNMLLNVGPDANGRFPDQAVAILERMGRWMDKNGQSIRGCGPAGLPVPEYGCFTAREDRVYCHLFDAPIGPVPLYGLEKDRIRGIRRLADGSEVPLSTSWVHSDYPDLAFADLGPDPALPDEIDTVLEVCYDR